jgi:hypothetical protein
MPLQPTLGVWCPKSSVFDSPQTQSTIANQEGETLSKNRSIVSLWYRNARSQQTCQKQKTTRSFKKEKEKKKGCKADVASQQQHRRAIFAAPRPFPIHP